MTKWEYRVIENSVRNAYGKVERQLNELGREGWELVTHEGGRYVLKRPVAPQFGQFDPPTT